MAFSKKKCFSQPSSPRAFSHTEWFYTNVQSTVKPYIYNYKKCCIISGTMCIEESMQTQLMRVPLFGNIFLPNFVELPCHRFHVLDVSQLSKEWFPLSATDQITFWTNIQKMTAFFEVTSDKYKKFSYLVLVPDRTAELQRMPTFVQKVIS